MASYRVIVPLIIGLFVWQGIAEAASISTRVRVLESKLVKQDKLIKNSLKSQKSRDSKVDASLAKVVALEKKMDKLLKASDKKKKHLERADKRYSFP